MSNETPDDDRTVIRPSSSEQTIAVPAGLQAAALASIEAGNQPASGNAGAATGYAPASAGGVATGAPTMGAASSAASSAGESGNALPVGTYVGEFELTSVLGEGGFGIVYLAWDHSLERKVALKEYMPSALSARVGSTQVQVKSARHRDTFEAGLRSFVNEAKLLASFDHPSLVKVYRFWEANGTAYMVMPFYEGITLKDKLREMGAPPDETWLMALLAPLTEALAVIHSASCFHRDIAPDNVILLGPSQKPLLLDFGAARRVIGDMTQALTVILKPGFAPVEQYAEAPNMKQGAWTDVYALAASVHFAIKGRTPPTSVGRLMSDSYVPLEQSAEGQYSTRFLRAIDRALRVRPEERTPSIAELRIDLGLDGPSSALDLPQPMASERSGLAAQQSAVTPSPSQPNQTKPAPGSASGQGASKGVWLGVAALLIVLGGGGAYFLGGSGDSLESRPANETLIASKSDPMQAAAPAASPATVVAPALRNWNPREEFTRLLQAQTASFGVEAVAAKQQFRIGKDPLAFNVKSGRDGFVNVLMLQPDGSILLLFPNALAPNNRIKAGQSLALPQSSWPLETAEPPGPQQFFVIVSAHPRDYSSLSSERDEMFLKLPGGDQAARLQAELQLAGKGLSSLLLGKAGNCEANNCDEFGAAQFSVDVIR